MCVSNLLFVLFNIPGTSVTTKTNHFVFIYSITKTKNCQKKKRNYNKTPLLSIFFTHYCSLFSDIYTLAEGILMLPRSMKHTLGGTSDPINYICTYILNQHRKGSSQSFVSLSVCCNTISAKRYLNKTSKTCLLLQAVYKSEPARSDLHTYISFSCQ